MDGNQENPLGNKGMKSISKLLKENTTLVELGLKSKLYSLRSFIWSQRNWLQLIDTLLNNEGIAWLGDSLKTNSTMTKMDLSCLQALHASLAMLLVDTIVFIQQLMILGMLAFESFLIVFQQTTRCFHWIFQVMNNFNCSNSRSHRNRCLYSFINCVHFKETGIEAEGARSLGEALKKNTSLIELFLRGSSSSQRITTNIFMSKFVLWTTRFIH